MENYIPLTDGQTKAYHDSVLAFSAFEAAQAALQPYRGWMYFKKVGTREYLFHAIDRQNNGKSMGARSPETEATLSTWLAGKEEATAAFARISRTLDEQRAICKALRLGRFPLTAAKLMRHLALHGVAQHFMVVGTNALYAYEAMAGVHFLSDLTATKDFDILWDARSRISFMADGDEQIGGLMAVLKKIDKTFTRNAERTFQAINASGFAVEVLRPEEPELPDLIAHDDGITPMHVKGLDALLSMPPAVETVVADDGFPLKVRVPDPAAYALHKLWVADQPDRRADKAARDRRQAAAVVDLIRQRLPQYSFSVDRVQNMAAQLLAHLDAATAAE